MNEDKLLQAIKIIVKYGEDVSTEDWHKACVEIFNLGLTEKDLHSYVESDPNDSRLGELATGNTYQAANYIWNYILQNDCISYCKEFMDYAQDYIKVQEGQKSLFLLLK